MPFVPQNHRINLEKLTGKVINDIPCHVSAPTIFVLDKTIPIEENDIIHYTPSNGLTEHYIVTNRGFHEAIGGFPAHYQVKYKRQ